jgi:phosphatidylserine decarboxylase
MVTWLLKTLTELGSRRWISRLAGRVAHSPASRLLIPRFARAYRINIGEAEKPLHEYATLNEFFTRRLKPGARPVDETPGVLVSPVDARITGMGPIRRGTILNIKGQDYTIDELLGGNPRADIYKNGYAVVLYLSPSDYHRIHSPVEGVVVERQHLPGRVYPVNDFGLTRLPRVLSRNERLVTYIRHEAGETAVVKVGALNVCGIRYADPSADRLTRGGELAWFEFGSTVVLLTEDGTFEPRGDLKPGDKVRMGEALGRLRAGS